MRTQALHPLPEESAIRRQAMIDAARGFEAHISVAYPEWFEREVREMLPRVEE
jgi:hypothetical protein